MNWKMFKNKENSNGFVESHHARKSTCIKLTFFSAISEEEKAEIKRGLLQCFREPFYPVALQLAVVVGKAAR